MRRHSSIQLLLLSLTGCSWMLLFLTLTLSDYHAFKAYHTSHVAAAHTTHTPPPKEIDPCDLCWNVGTNDPKDVLQGDEELSGLARLGARLAEVVGIGYAEQHNATPIPTPKQLNGRVGGVGAFYYYTLHTAFTSLQIRLKKAQLVAGDVEAEVSILEEKVASLHDILVNQFSPRMNPYQSNTSSTKPPVTSTRPTKDSAGTKSLKKSEEKIVTQSQSNQSNNGRTQKPNLSESSEISKKSVAPVNDIYALLHGQTQGSHSQLFPRVTNAKEENTLSEKKQKLFKFQESRQLLSFNDNIRKKITEKSDIQDFSPSGNKDKISETNHRFLVEENNHREGKEQDDCQGKRKYPKYIKGHGSIFLSITRNDIVNSVSVLIIDQENSAVNDFKETLAKLYPGIAVHFITSSSSVPRRPHNLRVMIHRVPINATVGTCYNVALDYVTTPYVFVATNISGLSSLTSIERLIWATEYLGVWATSASLLSPSGSWHLGCIEISKSHYQVTWLRRRLGTVEGYLICDSLEGPFLAVTSALRHLTWNTELPSAVSQMDLFLRASQIHNMLSAVCPQDIFNITHEQQVPQRASLLRLAKTHDIYSITVPPGVQSQFSCGEVSVKCGISSFVLSPCCRKELSHLVRFLMDTCDAHGLLCELQEGTLLGAVKTGGVMPWEKDADVTFHTNNFTALGELRDVFDRAGYSLHLVDNRWCCVEGRWAGGQGTLTSQHWGLELYSQHAMDSEDDLLSRRPRTRMQFDGSWVTVPTSPGLYVRNRYGTELYRHAQHWLDTGRRSGWEEYEAGKFLPCIKPSHHACLDEYLPDGNLKFRTTCSS